MIELTEEYKRKGFYIVSPIFYKEREFIKCGNVKDNNIYFYEIINNNVTEIDDDVILEEIETRFNYESDNKIY